CAAVSQRGDRRSPPRAGGTAGRYRHVCGDGQHYTRPLADHRLSRGYGLPGVARGGAAARPEAPAMTNAPFTHRPTLPRATHLRVGRLLLLALLGVGLLGGSVLWVLQTKARPLVQAVTDSGAWPPWLKQTPTYAAPEAKAAPAPTPAPVDQTAVELA